MGLWGGAFLEPSDDDLKALNDSIGFDKRMYRQDIEGSIAYAHAIQTAGILDESEKNAIIAGLEQVLQEFESGEFVLKPGDEDIHTAVERRLIEIVGAVGGKLHTGRSRNDQVATDFRLWVMATLDSLLGKIESLQYAFVEQSEQHITTLMPGYTHLQPAQPISVAQWLMSYFWMLERDKQRLRDARGRTAVSPLGAGALAGTPLMIDREYLATQLGFQSVSLNSLDAVSDRDFVAETLFALAMVGVHLSRFAEDVVLFSNPSFGYLTLNDRYSTGSSLMPQKRNADPMELTRGKAGRFIGNLTGLLATLKGLPTGYNKDLQEDKEALFDTVDQLNQLLPVLQAVVQTLTLNANKMQEALVEEMLATDLADYLVAKKMPFREAHHVVGRIVRLASATGQRLSQVPLTTLQEYSTLFEADVVLVFDFLASVQKRSAVGGTAPKAVTHQLAEAKALLAR